jgi:DNA-binding HxlR family transcriptional regulator
MNLMATTRKPSHENTAAACDRGSAALGRAFEFLGKRWNGVLLGTLRNGPAGFRELARAVDGISDSVLSDRLSDLSAAGLITRRSTRDRPSPSPTP